MKFLSRVVWSEGMLLGPHHFQTQSRYFEDTLWFLSASTHLNPWGLLHYSLDHETLRNGQAILSSASGILPDGLIFDLLDCDPLPAPARLKDLFTPTDTEITLHIAIPPRSNQDLDCDMTGGTAARYGAVHLTMRDDAYGQDLHDVSFARKNLSLVSQAELTPGTVSFAIARVMRDGKGGFVCDPDFIPPCLRIGASERLTMLLHRLLEAMDEKIDSVRRDRRGSGPMELGTSALDVANYWFLHCLCSTTPALRNHLSSKLSHPEELYRDLARLAGALSTFSLESSPDDVPKYSHEDLTSTFRDLDRLIRRLLDNVRPPPSLTLEFEKNAPYFHTADVKDERCLRRSRWIFGIRSSIGESTLLRLVPRLVKVCSARGVQTLVKRALPGLELLHLPVPPSALDAQADMHYFSISLDGACWQDIQNTREVGVYIPGEVGRCYFRCHSHHRDYPMNSPPASFASAVRTNSLAFAFQEVLTVVLRTRFNVQRWDTADRMRAAVRQMIASASQNVRALGYSDETTQMALYAIVGFLDESVLNSKDPLFSGWSGRPLGEELFGDHLAGEKFFRHIADLLNRPESSEVADILELHCLCLLLGFRGRYAFGDASEIHTILRRIREKIIRIRGPFTLVRQIEAPAVPKAPTGDRWVRYWSIAAIVLAIICLTAYISFRLLLIPSANNAAQVVSIPAPQPLAKSIGRVSGTYL